MSFAVVCGLEPVDFTDIFRVISPLQGVVSLTFRELSRNKIYAENFKLKLSMRA